MSATTAGEMDPLFALDNTEHLSDPPPAPARVATEPVTGEPRTSGVRRSEATRSILYMVEHALRYGKVRSLTQLLDQVAGFPQYKPYNALLVLLQRPAATYVLPAHDWEARYGRAIRPNEQPLVMLQPQGPVMFLFDVSQTEETDGSRPLPVRLENPYAMRPSVAAPLALQHVVENAKADGVRVLPARFGTPYAGCISRSTESTNQMVLTKRRPETHAEVAVRFEVLLNETYSPTEQLATLAHELGHLFCGHLGSQPSQLFPGEEFWRDRRGLSHPQKELEAESVARVVFRTLDPHNPLPPHLHQYFSTEPTLEGVSLEPILTAAGRVLEMSRGHAPRRPRSGTRSARR